MCPRHECIALAATLIVNERLAAKKAERDEEMRKLAEEEARLAKERMFNGFVGVFHGYDCYDSL